MKELEEITMQSLDKQIEKIVNEILELQLNNIKCDEKLKELNIEKIKCSNEYKEKHSEQKIITFNKIEAYFKQDQEEVTLEKIKKRIEETSVYSRGMKKIKSIESNIKKWVSIKNENNKKIEKLDLNKKALTLDKITLNKEDLPESFKNILLGEGK